MPRLRGIMSNLTDRIGDVKPGRFYVYVFVLVVAAIFWFA
jgi:hypothetical protein